MTLKDDLKITWPTPYGPVYYDSFWRCLRPVPSLKHGASEGGSTSRVTLTRHLGH